MEKHLSDTEIVEKYREVFQQFSKDGIIDMDKRLKHTFGYQVHRLENVIGILNGVMPPNRQSAYYITFFKNGSGSKSVGLFDFPITRNTLFIVPQRVIQATQHQSADCTGYVLNFNIDFFLNNAFPKQLVMDKKVFKSSLRPYLVVTAAQGEKLEAIYELLLSENASAQQWKNEMIATKILELLILCDRFFTDAEAVGEDTIYNPTIEKFNTLIEENFTQERSVQFYADALHIHRGHLNFLMKTHNGLSAKKAIDNRILLEAKYLLANTNDSVKETAHALGFEDVNYFSSFIRKMIGLSPQQYRATLQTSK